MQIGFVGIGQMGLPLCTNLLRAGYAVTAFDTNAAALEAIAGAGAQPASGLAELAGQVDTVITTLPSPHISEEVITGQGGLLEGARAGSIFVEMSTVSPGFIRRMDTACRAKNVTLLDCGMSGGPKGAAEATLTLMVGGDQAMLERVRPALEKMGQHIYHCGDTGAGMAAKLVNNALAHVNALSLIEGFSLGVKNGLDPKILFDIVATSSGMSWVLTSRFQQYIKDGSFNPGMTLDLLHKDSSLAMEMAQDSETPLFLLKLANSLFTWYRMEGMGPENWAKMMTIWEQRLGIRIGAQPPE
jgi:3-hydroxyisobutyrate dehydrogenase-like beta-hydroxyacid dehydrogenase